MNSILVTKKLSNGFFNLLHIHSKFFPIYQHSSSDGFIYILESFDLHFTCCSVPKHQFCFLYHRPTNCFIKAMSRCFCKSIHFPHWKSMPNTLYKKVEGFPFYLSFWEYVQMSRGAC